MNSKKVLRIKSGMFLMKVHPNRVETCDHIKDAMDLSELDFRTLQMVLENLQSGGYTEMKVMVAKV